MVFFFWDEAFSLIRSGEVGVLYDRCKGTEMDRVYPEGLRVISPLNKMYIYETRKQIVNHDFDVLTIKRLRVHLALAIRYRPELDRVGVLHLRIGPDYLTRVVVPQTESVMRKQLGRYTAEDIYTNAGGLLTRAILSAMEEIGRNFVEVEDIIIRRVELPERVKRAIEQKLVQQEKLRSYAFRVQTAEQEAERKRVAAAGLRDYQQTVGESLTDQVLRYQGITATREIAESDSEKTIVIGAGDEGMPLILGAR